MPEWIEPVEGFHMILRAKRPENPSLADQITSASWFYYPKMQEEKYSAADVRAAQAAFDLLLSEYRSDRIRSRGILNGDAPIDIDPIDAKSGKLSVFTRTLDCSSVIPGRVFRNVFFDKASIRRVIAQTVAPSASSCSVKYRHKFVCNYINNNPKTASKSGVRQAWKDAGHGTRYRAEIDAEYNRQAGPRGLLRKRGQRGEIAKS